MHPDLQLVTTLVTAGLPTLTVLVGMLISNRRLRDLDDRSDELHRSMDCRFEDIDRRFDQQRDLLRADLFRAAQRFQALNPW